MVIVCDTVHAKQHADYLARNIRKWQKGGGGSKHSCQAFQTPDLSLL
jgi:hypothetical protein